jgi:ATP/maltotriose-dependent transcriptional regulator MalT
MREYAVGGLFSLASLEMDAGAPSAALAALRRADGILDPSERSYRSTIQARIADAELILGNLRAAQAALELSDQLGPPEDVINVAITGSVRARFALADGDHEAAEQWARTAVEHAFMTDMPFVRADAVLGLARVLSGLGRQDEAAEQAHAALELYLQNGDQPGAARARAMLTDAPKVS